MAEETNGQLYTLSVMPALFLPPIVISGLFGMNVESLPLTDGPHGFGLVSVLAIVSAVAAYAIIPGLGIRGPG